MKGSLMKIYRYLKQLLSAALCMILLSSCSNIGTIPFDPNAPGYDLHEYSSVQIRMYHSGTENHIWELLEEFTYVPEEGWYFDIAQKGAEDELNVILQASKAEINDRITVVTDRKEIGKYALEVSGYDGITLPYQRYELLRNEEEQKLMLIAAGKDGCTFFTDVDLKAPYDALETNLDNVLITVTLQK